MARKQRFLYGDKLRTPAAFPVIGNPAPLSCLTLNLALLHSPPNNKHSCYKAEAFEKSNKDTDPGECALSAK